MIEAIQTKISTENERKESIMPTVVITGSARGLGFELAKEFRKNNYNVVLSDIMEDKLKEAKKILKNVGTPSVSKKRQKVFQYVLKLSCAAAIGAGVALMFMSL